MRGQQQLQQYNQWQLCQRQQQLLLQKGLMQQCALAPTAQQMPHPKTNQASCESYHVQYVAQKILFVWSFCQVREVSADVVEFCSGMFRVKC